MPVRAIKLPHYYAVLRASLQRVPGVEGADQSRPNYADVGLVQCFRLSIVVGRGNVSVSRYLRPKSIADTLSITLFKSIADNSQYFKNIGDKVSAIVDTSILTNLLFSYS